MPRTCDTLFDANGGGKGSKGASAAGGTVQRAAFEGAKIWNSEIGASYKVYLKEITSEY